MRAKRLLCHATLPCPRVHGGGRQWRLGVPLNRQLSRLLLGLVLLSLPGLALTVTNRMLTETVNANSCSVPVPATTFLTTDQAVWLWFNVTGANAGDVASVTWYSPDGTAYDSGSWSPVPSAGGWCYSWYIAVADYPPASSPGNWSVQVGWNGSPLFTLPFSIVAAVVPSINTGGITNAASSSQGPFAAGSHLTIKGANLANATTVVTTAPLPTTLNGAQVSVGGVAAPLLYVSPTQINLQVPWELSGQTQASVSVQVDLTASAPQTMSLAPYGPGIYATNGSGTGQGAVQIANTTFFAAPAGMFPGSRPVQPGEYISIYATGLGAVTNQPASGAFALADPLSWTSAIPTVTLGGVPAPVTFSGLGPAPGNPGLCQVNALVPANAPSGDAVPLSLSIGNVVSNTVTIAVAGTPPPLYTLSVTETGTGTGTVTSSPAGIACGATCSASYANGTQITLTATADPGSAFAGWSGACSGTGTCAVTMNAAATVTASFNTAGQGAIAISISPATATVQTGGTVQFTATVTGASNLTVTWSVNGATGGNSTLGTVSNSGLYTAPSTAPNPNTVTVTATSVADSTKSASATVTINARTPGQVQISISPTSATIAPGSTQQFSASVTGTANTGVTWSVNNIAGGNATVGTISTTGLYTAPPVVPSPNTVTVTASSAQDPSQFASATVSITASTANGITISSLSSTSLAPFGLLSINGSGFDSDAQLQVTFFNTNGFSVTVPVLLATSTAVATSVPPFFDGSGNLASGTVNIEVAQLSSLGTTTYSNVLSGFQIQAVAAAPPLPPGTLTLALLQATLQSTTNLQSSSGTALASDVQGAISSQIASLQNTISQVQSVVSGATPSFTIGQFDGSNINVGPSDLAITDRLVVGLLTTFAGPTPDLGAFSGSSGGALASFHSGLAWVKPADAPGVSSTIQGAAQAALAAATNSLTPLPQLTQALANFTGSFANANISSDDAKNYLTMMVGAVLGGVAVAVVGAPTIVLAGSLALTAEVTTEEALWVSVTTAIAVCAHGPIGSVMEFEQGVLVKTFLTGLWGEIADQLLLFHNVMTIIENHGCNLGGGGGGSQYTLTTGTSGAGSGTVSAPSPPGTSCGTNCWSYVLGSVVTLTATPNPGSAFTGWSGACSGTGTCTVTMNSNLSVTATFNPVITLSSLTLSASAVTGGNSVTGTVTLSAAAPAGGTTVTLQSSSGVAQVPSSVTVPAGQTSATFTVGTSVVTAQTTATISATLGSVVKTAALTVNPQSPPAGSNWKYCINTCTWTGNAWNDASWVGSNTPGSYPFGTNDNIVTYTYSCSSQVLPDPCGAICQP